MSKRFINLKSFLHPAIAIAALALVALTATIVSRSAYAARRLLSDAETRQLGLQRAWFAQVSVDPARNRLERAVLYGDWLTVMTSAGVVQELNALTGETTWTARVGNPDHPSLGPAANDKAIAIVNGSTLYVVDKNDGKPIVVRRVGGAPGAAPALAENYVFVPLVTGRIEAYPIDEEQKLTPWYYQSYGRAMVPPMATAESVVWATDSGHMYVGNSKDLRVKFRLEAGSEIVAPPASGPPYVYAATSTGEVFSMNEATGERRWKYAAGFPIHRAPAVVGDRVFVSSEEPMLHCIDATSGAEIWSASGVNQFAAASKTRVYGVDDLGALVVLDAATGAPLGRIFRDTDTRALVNDQTDRIYLVSEDGLVQCYHELDARQPMYHRPKPAPPAPPATEAAPATTSEATPVDTTQPQPPVEEEAEPADEDPFAGGEEAGEMPADEAEPPAAETESPASEQDPFGALEQ
jgi:outer membrane protein assembly factor BamB